MDTPDVECHDGGRDDIGHERHHRCRDLDMLKGIHYGTLVTVIRPLLDRECKS